MTDPSRPEGPPGAAVPPAPISKAEAQARADRVRAFREELRDLEQRDVLRLTPDQRAAVAAWHESELGRLARQFDVDVSETQKQMSWGMRIASFLGALAFCAAVYFFFHRFWGLLSTPAQVVLLVAAPVAATLLTEIAARLERTLYFAALAALVAFACFVLNLSLFGTIFNITPSQNALLVWAGFAFLLAYAYDLRLLLVAGILSFLGYLSATTGTWRGCYWLDFGERPENFILWGFVLFALPLVAPHRRRHDFPPMYRLFGLLAVLLPVLVLSNWGEISYLTLDDGTVEHIYQIAGFVLSALAIWIGIRRGWRGVTNLGCTFFVIFLYTKLYDWWWDWMPKYLFFTVLGLTSVAILAGLKRLRLLAVRAGA